MVGLSADKGLDCYKPVSPESLRWIRARQQWPDSTLDCWQSTGGASRPEASWTSAPPRCSRASSTSPQSQSPGISQDQSMFWSEKTNLKDFVHCLLSFLTVDCERNLFVGVRLLKLPRYLCLPLFQHGHVEGKGLVDLAQRFFVLTRQPGGEGRYKLCNA